MAASVAVHDPGHRPVLPRAAGVRRRRDADRREGVSPVRGRAVRLRMDPGLPRPRRAGARRRARRGGEPSRGDGPRVRRAVRRSRASPPIGRRSRRSRRSTRRSCATPERAARAAVDRAASEAGSTCWSRSRWRRRVAECDAMIEASRSLGRLPDGRALLAVPRRGDRAAGPDRGRRARRDRQDARVRRARRLGARAAGSPIPRSPAAARSSDMGVHAIDTARFLLGDPEPGRGLRGDRHPVRGRALRGRRRRDPADPLGERDELPWSSPGGGSPHLGGLEADTEVYGTAGYARIWPPEEPSRGLRALHAADVLGADGRVPGRDRARAGSRARAARTVAS